MSAPVAIASLQQHSGIGPERSLKEAVWTALEPAPPEARDFVYRLFDVSPEAAATDVVIGALARFEAYTPAFKSRIVDALERALRAIEGDLPPTGAVVAGLVVALRAAAVVDRGSA